MVAALLFLALVQDVDLQAEIDKVAGPVIASQQQYGLVVGVIRGDRRLISGYGVVAKGQDLKPDGDTVFEIASISKVFTAALLADSVERGIVKLDQPVVELLPQEVRNTRGDHRAITLLQLCTHTSGLPRLPGNLAGTIKTMDDPYANYGPADLYAYLPTVDLDETTGKYLYSNLGAGLLGHALALKLGKSYEAAVEERVCVPIGLRDTVITLSEAQKKRLATGHLTDGKAVPLWSSNVLAGSYAFRSTANDLLTFLSANMGLTKTDLLPALESCHAPRVKGPTADVGLAWHVSPLIDRTMVWHNGGSAGFYSFIGFVRETKTAVVVLGNTAAPVDEIAIRILAAIGLK